MPELSANSNVLKAAKIMKDKGDTQALRDLFAETQANLAYLPTTEMPDDTHFVMEGSRVLTPGEIIETNTGKPLVTFH
ncbi:MAG: hypothetical protein Q9195_001021 [Heterodermia aff. obscurata]